VTPVPGALEQPKIQVKGSKAHVAAKHKKKHKKHKKK